MNKQMITRILVMVVGVIFLGLGISIFKLALLGNDPYTGMLFAISDVSGFPYAWLQAVMAALLFVFQLLFGRHLIGIGTVVNAFFVGFIVDFWYGFLIGVFGQPEGLPLQLLTMAIGMLVCSLGISMYQEADLGVSPYDATSLMMAERQSKLPYFWCRIITDSICAIVCFAFGGIVGIGTVVTALGFGPFVTFYNRLVSDPLLRLGGVEK